MKAIIIEEVRFPEIRDLLIAESERLGNKPPEGMDARVWKAAVDQSFRNLNFHFVRWAQDQGVSFNR